ncbi:MAG: hypothetical protein H7Y20_00335, partial [Bryobacteraceae bacterium]|nr:hypothetical protein [Bryobacteraceae bacterium]
MLESRDAAAMLRSRTTTVDGQVAHAYRSYLAGPFPRGMALVAVGGYGRRELFPYSDIDLLLLVDKDMQTDEQREALSVFLRSLWDVSLRLSQSVRTVADCTKFDEHNVELSVSLLDARFLIGDSDLFEQLNERLVKFFRAHRQALLQRVCNLTEARHEKFHRTIYHLEPNIKEGPGGLRDLQAVHWLARLRDASPDAEPELAKARDFLWDLRCNLHGRAGRDSNVLTFDLQEQIASDPALWMREFFRHARVVNRNALRAIEQCEQALATGLMRSFRDWRSRLSNSEISVVRDRVMLRTPQTLATDPFALLRLFEFVARHGLRLSIDAERRVRETLERNHVSFADKTGLWPALHSILALPHSGLALRAMHDTGVLPLLVPAWKSIECLVVRDFYHRYTVDEHTLVAIEHITALRTNEDPARRRFAEMLNETPDPALLVLALLFHDTGKSEGLAGHAHSSAIEAGRSLPDLGMPDEERALVVFLIEHHLDLSAVINARDVDDPVVAEELAHSVETLEKLRYLTLLTYADISAVNPEAMTPWRLEQLWHTYVAGHRELTRELDSDRIHLRLTDDKEREKEQWLEGFPTRYLRTHSEQQIGHHLELSRQNQSTGAAIELERRSGFWGLTVVTSDRPGLLAGLAGAVSSFGMNIVRAEAFANSGGVVLDSIVFEDPLRTLELNPPEVERLKTVLKRVVLGKEDVGKLLQGRPRPAAPTRTAQILPAVFFDNEGSGTATLVEIVAQDRPGLLYDLATAFSAAGCSIDVVLIDTEAHKAIDVFYVTLEGGKLSADLQNALQAGL